MKTFKGAVNAQRRCDEEVEGLPAAGPEQCEGGQLHGVADHEKVVRVVAEALEAHRAEPAGDLAPEELREMGVSESERQKGLIPRELRASP